MEVHDPIDVYTKAARPKEEKNDPSRLEDAC